MSLVLYFMHTHSTLFITSCWKTFLICNHYRRKNQPIQTNKYFRHTRVAIKWKKGTSSQGIAICVLSVVEVSIQMKWPFCSLQFCGWDPTLGDALNFHPFPSETPDTFQNPERDQLPAALCQMQSYLCSYRTAVALWIAPTKLCALCELGENEKLLENNFFVARLLWFYATYFPHTGFLLHCVSVYVWIWLTFNESLVLSVGFVPPASVFALFLRKEEKITFVSVTIIVIFD